MQERPAAKHRATATKAKRAQQGLGAGRGLGGWITSAEERARDKVARAARAKKLEPGEMHVRGTEAHAAPPHAPYAGRRKGYMEKNKRLRGEMDRRSTIG
jgi:hypothetical protein